MSPRWFLPNCPVVALCLQQLGDRDVPVLETRVRTRHADLRETGPEYALPGDKSRTAGRAALFRVVVGELHALGGDPVDVWRIESRHAERTGTDVGLADVITPEDDDIRLAGLRAALRRRGWSRQHACERQQAGGVADHVSKCPFHLSPLSSDYSHRPCVFMRATMRERCMPRSSCPSSVRMFSCITSLGCR